LGDKMVTDTVVALVYKAILEAIRNSGNGGPRASRPGLAGFYLVLNKGAGHTGELLADLLGQLLEMYQ
jgi:hypothetical protein